MALAAVAGAGMTDHALRTPGRGGMVGIIGASASIGAGYRPWLRTHPNAAATAAAPVEAMVSFTSSLTRAARDHGEFGTWLDEQMRSRHLAAFTPWIEDPDALDAVPTPDDWAAHVHHVIESVGADHVGIGLDLVGGRSCVRPDADGYPAADLCFGTDHHRGQRHQGGRRDLAAGARRRGTVRDGRTRR